MKKLAILFICVSILFSGCSKKLSDAEVMDAFGTVMSAYLMTTFSISFGQPVTGAKLDPVTGELIIENMELMDIQSLYQTLDGTITVQQGVYVFDFTLTGGPVKTFYMEMSEEEFRKDVFEGEMTLTLNGKEYIFDSSTIPTE